MGHRFEFSGGYLGGFHSSTHVTVIHECSGLMWLPEVLPEPFGPVHLDLQKLQYQRLHYNLTCSIMSGNGMYRGKTRFKLFGTRLLSRKSSDHQMYTSRDGGFSAEICPGKTESSVIRNLQSLHKSIFYFSPFFDGSHVK